MTTKNRQSATTEKPVWFITGCSTGFGRELAKHALERGYRTVVTARKPDEVKDLAAQGEALVLKLDVTNQGQINAAIKAAEKNFGRIDVLVNNAGIGYFAAVEESEEKEVRRMFEINVFGLSRIIQAVLPGMRKRRQGFIVNFSSIGGLRSFPSVGYYNATKFAVEGLSEALWQEVEPPAIKVMLLEPSGFRTDWAGRSANESKRQIADYAATAGACRKEVRAISGKQPGDPVRAVQEVKSFTDYALSTAPPAPTYYPRMKKLNAKGPEVLGNLPPVRGLPPKFFQEATEDKRNVLIDTRMMLAFGGGHIKGALSIGASPMLSIWAGWLLDPTKPNLLVLESDEQLNEAVRLFLRTGYTKFAGYLVGGMRSWDNAGLPLVAVGQMTVQEIKQAGKKLQLLDVRSRDEWNKGHIPNASHVFLGELHANLGELDQSKPTAVYCDSGYRASIATSILKQAGFASVYNVPESWQAWKKAGFPVEMELKKETK